MFHMHHCALGSSCYECALTCDILLSVQVCLQLMPHVESCLMVFKVRVFFHGWLFPSISRGSKLVSQTYVVKNEKS
jgi:hypothetical protein